MDHTPGRGRVCTGQLRARQLQTLWRAVRARRAEHSLIQRVVAADQLHIAFSHQAADHHSLAVVAFEDGEVWAASSSPGGTPGGGGSMLVVQGRAAFNALSTSPK